MPQNTWDLGADPAALERAAGKWRAVQLLATAGARTVNDAARQVVGTDWQAESADAYDDHRARLTRDIDSLAEIAEETAAALESLAGTLRSAQEQLDLLLGTLNRIPRTTRADGTIDFNPEDTSQSQQLREAIAQAETYHGRVGEEMALKEARFVAAQQELADMKQRWSPETVNLVNLNIGSGNDNDWRQDKEGVGKDEVDELAELLVSQDADIATIQEVFDGDLEDLERELEERTGDDWDYSYAEASTKPRYGGGGLPWDVDANAGFGNAVFVREGESIDLPENPEILESMNAESPALEVQDHKLDREGGQFDENTEDGEGRSAAHVEVTFDN